MFKFSVFLVHGLIFIFAIFIAYFGVNSPAEPEPNQKYGVLITAFATYNVLVIISLFTQLKIKKTSVFLISILVLIVLFYFLPHIVLFLEDLIYE